MMKLAILLVVGVIARHAYGDEPEAIVGGNLATPGQFPYQCSLQFWESHICGCTIIDSTHILTAAHCVDKMDQRYLQVVSGAHKSSDDGQYHNIKCIRMHPGYTGKSSDGWKDDIAVITLRTPMQFNDRQRPIPLADKDYSGTNGIISGWGKTSVDSGVSPILKWAAVYTLPQLACLHAHPNREDGNAFTNPKHICTFAGKGTGACQGDSGGPLVINNMVCGVTSWVAPCALGVPDVYTNTYYYLDFINESKSMC